MPDHVANRDKVLERLRDELVGPSPCGEDIDCSGEIRFADAALGYRPYRQLGSGEEILQRDTPTKRYGIGVLYPICAAPGPEDLDVQAPPLDPAEAADIPADGAELLQASAAVDCEKIAARSERHLPEADEDDFDLSSANAYKPSSMGVSFLVRLPPGAELQVEAGGGRYRQKTVSVAGRQRDWWLRSPVKISAHYRSEDFPKDRSRTVRPFQMASGNLEGLDIRVELLARPRRDHADTYLVTVCLINRDTVHGRLDPQCLFQSHFRISANGQEAGAQILPYPAAAPLDDEERSVELLYREKVTFAVGHGCAADWRRVTDATRVAQVSAECLPIFETPSITPDITDDTGRPLVASMRALAGLDQADDGSSSLERIVVEYEAWIARKRAYIPALAPSIQVTASIHLDQCAAAAARMRDGQAFLASDARARRAFQLANRAILIQQIRSRREARATSFDFPTATLYFQEHYKPLDVHSPTALDCQWRAFQIAFILAALRSTADHAAPEREHVELIWFPTGGGKTEAYLGLAAFDIFLRRLRDPSDIGVQVLMRYTLRLLTAQQFQRASRLICAMEYLRRQFPSELGGGEISTGIWLGRATTPNTREDARAVFRRLTQAGGEVENKFVLDRCPWCGAQMGPVSFAARRGTRQGVPKVIGYERRGDTVAFACPDHACEFQRSLPVYVIDEDIYEHRPDLVIGTVDKFAMLAWRPEARAIFGLAEDGQRFASPPGLIIQDELHLISGPLGSMVGLYEPVIEHLCTDGRQHPPVHPKLISSTATIRSYREQILGLYGRKEACLFPPPGLESDDSFFARCDRTRAGELQKGRIYIGVHAPGLGSLQTVQVRTLAALLQASQPFRDEERDPWWTLLLFFNSLRELGTTVTLFQSDIPDYLKVLRGRYGLEFRDMRPIRNILELTGRLSGDEVPKAISALEIPVGPGNNYPIDVCLASNIIEVGIDIDRLSLMGVVGQPKTTSQYIQVTGRVGRKRDRPGLVVTIYAASKPRDRSHFEKFRSYHERLYAQVEPTSVTPFSRPALDRAAHAVVASYVRQCGDQDHATSPYPFPEDLAEAAAALLEQRAAIVDPDELDALQRIVARRASEWRRWERLRWSGSLQAEDIPLLRPAGAYVPRDKARVSWATPQSLRSVDAECQVEITQLYTIQEEDDA